MSEQQRDARRSAAARGRDAPRRPGGSCRPAMRRRPGLAARGHHGGRPRGPKSPAHHSVGEFVADAVTPSARSADCRGSGSSLRRRFLMCASIARSNDSTSSPRIASSSCAAREHPAGLTRQRRQQLELGGGEIDGAVADARLHPRLVERDVAGADDVAAIRRRRRFAGTPRARARRAPSG